MIRIKEIAFTGYPITDLVRARAFYEGLLGLQVTMNFEHEGKAWIEYEVGASTFAITNMSAEWTPSAQGPCATFEVENFTDAVETLRAKGVPFKLEPTETPVCHFASVLDPDGNCVSIHAKKSP